MCARRSGFSQQFGHITKKRRATFLNTNPVFVYSFRSLSTCLCLTRSLSLSSGTHPPHNRRHTFATITAVYLNQHTHTFVLSVVATYYFQLFRVCTSIDISPYTPGCLRTTPSRVSLIVNRGDWKIVYVTANFPCYLFAFDFSSNYSDLIVIFY